MKFRLAVAAKTDISPIARYYEEASAGLGLRFANELETTLNYLAANPGLGMRLSVRTQRWLLDSFPYIVLYRASSIELLVVRVVHQKRNPNSWRKAL